LYSVLVVSLYFCCLLFGKISI